uniref:Conotoxin-like S2 n=1 Tax=Odontomachus monticola TaxID=613454 RepID=A0A348G5W4_ODOMO
MAKLLAVLFVALFVVTLAAACAPPGYLCSQSNDCCIGTMCNPWSGRCTKPKTWNIPSNDNGNGNVNGNGPQTPPWRWWGRAAGGDGAGWNWPPA